MRESTVAARRSALETMFQAVLEKRADKKTVEACHAWSEQATAEDVAFLVDRAVDRGIDFETLKPGVSKLINILYASLKRVRYEIKDTEYFFSSLIRENQGAVDLLAKARSDVAALNLCGSVSGKDYADGLSRIRNFAERVSAIDIHYRKKENILFPKFESLYPDYRCVHLMWSIQDDVRRSIRRLRELTESGSPLVSELNGEIGKIYFDIHAVLFREEHIIFPILSRLLRVEELNDLFLESLDFGFCFLSDADIAEFSAKARDLKSTRKPLASKTIESRSDFGFLDLDTGKLAPDTLNRILTALPLDMTFVDQDGRVAWYSDSRHRIFPRSPAVIGRDVRNCHPKESMDKVIAILDAFREGRRDREAFWIRMRGRLIHIEYFAIRDAQGRYLGTLELTQDLTDKADLKGEKRLADSL